MDGRRSQFILVEKQGYSEREVFESDDLEELAEFLEAKTGVFDTSIEVDP